LRYPAGLCILNSQVDEALVCIDIAAVARQHDGEQSAALTCANDID